MERPANVFAKIRSNQQRNEQVALWKNAPYQYTGMRAHAIILSDAQYEIEQIVEIFGVKGKRFVIGSSDSKKEASAHFGTKVVRASSPTDGFQ